MPFSVRPPRDSEGLRGTLGLLLSEAADTTESAESTYGISNVITVKVLFISRSENTPGPTVPGAACTRRYLLRLFKPAGIVPFVATYDDSGCSRSGKSLQHMFHGLSLRGRQRTVTEWG